MDIFLNNLLSGISIPAPPKLLKPPEIKPLTKKKIFRFNVIFF